MHMVKQTCPTHVNTLVPLTHQVSSSPCRQLGVFQHVSSQWVWHLDLSRDSDQTVQTLPTHGLLRA